MHHVAIMNPRWKLIPKILSGEKTIESRWYQTRRAPWDKIAKGDTVFFKNVGELVTARAEVTRVVQFAFQSPKEVSDVVLKYGKKMSLVNVDPKTWGKVPKYAVLVFLEHPRPVDPPLRIDKTGFGMAVAWVVIDDIKKIVC